MKLILVRHGETLSNRENRVQGITDTELSDHGHAQVEKLAESLRYEPIDGIVSSPLKRAYQTAQAISKFHKTAIEVENNLQEMNHGDFENVTIAELKEKHLPRSPCQMENRSLTCRCARGTQSKKLSETQRISLSSPMAWQL